MRAGTTAVATVLLIGFVVNSVANEGAGFGDGPYLGQEPPGVTAEIFSPGLIRKDESAGCSGFLNDGTVFVYSSMKVGTDWRFKPTYVMEQKGGRWTEPEIAPFSKYMPYNFTVGPGGKTVYFTTLKSPDKSTSTLLEQANIWAVTLTADGKYLFFTGPDPDNDEVGRIFWVSSEVIHAKFTGG